MSWDWHITPIGIARFLSPLIVLMGRHQEKGDLGAVQGVPRSAGPGLTAMTTKVAAAAVASHLVLQG